MSDPYPPPPAPPPPPPSGGPSGPRASFGTRFLAAFVDGLILGVLSAVLRGISDSAGEGLGLLTSLAYFSYLEGSPSGQTIGKRALGIRVIDLGTGGPIGYGRALLRWVGRFVSSLVILLGYFWMLWDRERQTWHDKMAGSVVVPTSAYPVEAWPG